MDDTLQGIDADSVAFLQAMVEFHSGARGAIGRLSKKIEISGNTYRAQLAQSALAAGPVSEISTDDLVVGETLNGLKVTESLLAACKLLLNANATFKLRFLNGDTDISLFDDIEPANLHGTLLVEVPFLGLSAATNRVFLISLQSPLDAVYYPAHRLIIRSATLRFPCVERLPKLYNWILRNGDLYEEYWDRFPPSAISFLVRDKRPYHVLLDELSGHFELMESGLNLPLLFFERSSFVEDSNTISFTRPRKNIFSDIVVSNHRRADKDDFACRYYCSLKQKANQLFGKETLTHGIPIVWISIAGGEKRRWIEESAALEALVKWAQKRFGKCHFIVDGWTSPKIRAPSDAQQILDHNRTWEQIRAATKLERDDFTSVIGASVFRKIQASQQAHFFVSCAGTPSVWPSLISRVPGVVHNSKSMIRRVGNTYYPKNVVRIPDECIEDINEMGENIRWDRYSYSISPADLLNAADLAFKYMSS